MTTRTVLMVAMGIGSTIGSCIPLIWGDSFLSLSSVILTGIGGFAGIWVGYKMTR